MSSQQIIYQTNDRLGQITVSESDSYRVLHFDSKHEQSRCSLDAPYIPQYEYIQAMMLSLLFADLQHTLVLGLGGGSLVNALMRQYPDVHVTAVELRAEVIEIAKRYFFLPDKPTHLELVNTDASSFVKTCCTSYDVIFADLYLAEQVDKGQLSRGFIHRCRSLLTENGWLVLNGWSRHRENAEFIAALNEYFADVRTVLCDDKNWVILAGVSKSDHSDKQLREDAVAYSRQLGFSLTRHFNKLRPLGS